jgi:hypothetical protein
MAPEIAMEKLRDIGEGKVVLDPMVGSGTVMRHAVELGHKGIGFDLDPLAVLMTDVATAPVSEPLVLRILARIIRDFQLRKCQRVALPWIDDDTETSAFVQYWFGVRQRRALRLIANYFAEIEGSKPSANDRAALNVLRISLSRIIITKDRGASLARDVSHSRPHKVENKSDFDVLRGFQRSVAQVLRLLGSRPASSSVNVLLGDARNMSKVDNASVDIVLTSPPYLNAIDYLRGHKLSLVWLGYRISELRAIRSSSIGAERAPDSKHSAGVFEEIKRAMCASKDVDARHTAMIARYSEDLYRMTSEVARVLKRSGRAVFVVGNSCLRGTFVRNSEGVASAAKIVGLKLLDKTERPLPSNRRYLPIPIAVDDPLGGRMRTETILTFGR